MNGATKRRRTRYAASLFIAGFLLLPVTQALAANITIELKGPGTGTVTSSPAGTPTMNCSNVSGPAGPTCVASYSAATHVEFTAVPGPGSTFAGWESTSGSAGACKGGSTSTPCLTGLPGTAFKIEAEFVGTVNPPEVTIDPVASGGVTAHGAMFEGTVNPKGSELSACRFEYITDAQFSANGASNRFNGASQKLCNLTPAEIGGLEDSVDVSASAANLLPRTTYHVRLVAAKGVVSAATPEPNPAFTTRAAPPAVVTEKSWSATDTTATLSGEVNPENASTTYHFEYVPDTEFQESEFADALSTPSVGAGSGIAGVKVFANIAELRPATAYHFRLVAENGVEVDPEHDPGDTASAGASSLFETYPKPVFPQRGYELVSAADTNGIRPVPDATALDGDSYSYATGIPAPGATGDGKISYFRAVRLSDGSWSQDAVGIPPALPGEFAFAMSSESYSSNLSLMAFESQESLDPGDQNGAEDAYLENLEDGRFIWLSRNPALAPGVPQTEAGNAGHVVYISPDGTHVLFESERKLLPSDLSAGASVFSLYEWTQQPANGHQSLIVKATSGEYTITKTAAIAKGTLTVGSPEVRDVSITSAGGVFHIGDAISGAGIPAGTKIAEVGEGTLILSESATAPGGSQSLTVTETTQPIAASAGESEVRSALEALLAIGAGNVAVSGGTGDATGSQPYGIEFTGTLAGAYVGPLIATNASLSGGNPASAVGIATVMPGGHLSLVGVEPGKTSGFAHGSTFGSLSGQRAEVIKAGVSKSGSRVVFSAEASSARHLYVRKHGEDTVEASASAPSISPPITSPFNVQYQGADAEDATVFFTSSSKLTTTSGITVESGTSPADLYRYDVPADGDPADGQLTDLTPGVSGGAGVARVYDISDDGHRVYFTASKQLLPGAGTAGQPNLYLWEDDGTATGKLRFIATIDPLEDESGTNTGGVNSPPNWREEATDPSGSVLAFRDRLPAVPGVQTSGMPQVFIYSAPRDELSCASCPTGGGTPIAASNLTAAVGLGSGLETANEPLATTREPKPTNVSGSVTNSHAPHASNVSSTGAVFFQTANALLPADTNEKIDTYEWRDGKLALISAGSGSQDSIFAGATPDGSTVFFRSAEELVPGAQQGIQHIFAAREGSPTFSPPSLAPPCASAEDCRLPQPAPPAEQVPGSGLLTGPGNDQPRRPRSGNTRRKKRHRKKHARHSKKEHRRAADDSRRARG